MASGEILETPQIIFDKLQGSQGGACVHGDCIRKERLCTNGSTKCIDVPAPARSLRKVFWINEE